MKKIFLSIAVCGGLFAAGINDTEIGLRKHSLNDENKLEIKDFSYSDKAAGEAKRYERAFLNAPPQIPHDVSDYLPITQEDNMCLSCHDLGTDNERVKLSDDEPTPMPASHYYDFRDEKKLENVSEARYNCVQCHAPQANIESGIKNTFQPDFGNDELNKHRSNLLDVLNEGL